MKTTKQLIALAAGLLLATGSYSQSTFGEIRGKIMEKETNLPMWGANVWVEVNGTKQGASTDSSGKFTIKPLAPGKYILNASFIGKATIRQGVIVKPDQISWENSLVMMDDDSSATAMDEFVVVEYKIKLIDPEQTSKKTIDYEEMKHNPNLRDIKKLAASTGSDFQVHENGDAYVRGSRSDAAIYFIDGVKATSGIRVPGVAIGSLTVYTGGVPAKYGDVTSGVVIVETKSYMDLYNEARIGK